MDNAVDNISLILRGGFLMYPLMLLSIYVVGIVIFKILQFKRQEIFSAEFAEKAIDQIKKKNLNVCEATLSNSASPLARVMETAIGLKLFSNLPANRVEPEIERIGMAHLQELNSHLKGLEIVAGVAPLIGLLGTVIGMVKAFGKLAESSSRIDPSLLAGGIWEALITTIGGLVVAIPAFVAYYIFENYLDKLRAQMKDYATQILNLESSIKDGAKTLKKSSNIKANW